MNIDNNVTHRVQNNYGNNIKKKNRKITKKKLRIKKLISCYKKKLKNDER